MKVTPKAPPGPWIALAACRGLPTSMFFLGKTESSTSHRAKAVCASCRCREACVSYAISDPVEIAGIWGGHGPRALRAIRNQRDRDAA